MKVKKLIKLLQKFDPDSIVIMQGDPEGNGYAPLSDAEGNGSWNKKDREYGYATLTKELEERGYSEEDCIAGEPAVVLWPAW
jgi:hypothetical protein